MGLTQGRLQAEACALELSFLTFGYLAVIGCCEWAKGLFCVSFAQGLVAREHSLVPALVDGRWTSKEQPA